MFAMPNGMAASIPAVQMASRCMGCMSGAFKRVANGFSWTGVGRTDVETRRPPQGRVAVATKAGEGFFYGSKKT